MPKIIKKIPTLPQVKADKNVAAYARVSTGKDAMLHSLSAQVSYYSTMIQSKRGWKYVGVYADEAFTGTKQDRENFQRMLEDCRAGKIDIIITKSVSRFARNTLTLLETIRELKTKNIDVYFEEQNIHSNSSEGELMLTILASYAQEESRSASENQKWRVNKNFTNGIPWTGVMLGYHHNNKGSYEITVGEDLIVKRIFEDYLSGMGYLKIAKSLNEDGILSRRGFKWSADTVSLILQNYAYTGSLLLQKTYKENHLTKKKIKNSGELPMYHAENTHEAIISKEVFFAVQQERERRAKKYYNKDFKLKKYPFSHKILCMCCGKNYRRKVKPSQVVWICGTYNTKGKNYCSRSKQIPERVLYELSTEVLGLTEFDEDIFYENINCIVADENNTLIFEFINGDVVTKTWKDKSRSESWSPEMREQARRRALCQAK